MVLLAENLPSFAKKRLILMKKFLALLLSIMLLSTVALAEVKIGQVEYAAHGTSCFAVLTVAMDGDTIVAAHIDEFQFMDAATAEGVPNSDASFGANYPEGKVLASKVVNNGLYSTNMATKAGATTPLGVSYEAIEAFVTGKTIAELEAAIADKTKEEMVDAVSSSTLVDTLGYVQGLLAAAKAANNVTGYYTVYNKTGEAVKELSITINATGEKVVAATDMAADAVKVIAFSMDGALANDGLTFTFTTESGYEGVFETLHIETTPITLLAADAMTGATPISFFAPAAE